MTYKIVFYFFFLGNSDGNDESKDTGINLALYFEKSCFKGYGEDERVLYYYLYSRAVVKFRKKIFYILNFIQKNI